MKNCPECNSENIILDAKAIDRGDSNVNLGFQVAIDGDPDAFIFKQTTYSTVNVNICGDCGYIRFYAANLQALWDADQNRQH
jgi:hypothetical protein